MDRFLPKTKLGKWSVVLIILMPILFVIGGSFTDTLYESTPAGSTILEDVIKRPFLSITMLLGMLSGILAFVLGFISIAKKKERSLLAYISTALGAMLTLFIIGEIIFPH